MQRTKMFSWVRIIKWSFKTWKSLDNGPFLHVLSVCHFIFIVDNKTIEFWYDKLQGNDNTTEPCKSHSTVINDIIIISILKVNKRIVPLLVMYEVVLHLAIIK
jgi:hypothetical protein